MSISKIILICYFIVSRFQDALQHENREDFDSEIELIKKELEIEILKNQDGFQMIDSNYKQKVWDKMFYKGVDQKIVTVATFINIFLFIYLILSLVEFFNSIRIFLMLSQF